MPAMEKKSFKTRKMRETMTLLEIFLSLMLTQTSKMRIPVVMKFLAERNRR